MNKHFTLGDGEALNSAHPNTFLIPTREEREDLAIGMTAKLMFEQAAMPAGRKNALGNINSERMWVTVTEKVPGGYVGKLDNTPVVVKAKHGQVVRFEARHVIGIHPAM